MTMTITLFGFHKPLDLNLLSPSSNWLSLYLVTFNSIFAAAIYNRTRDLLNKRLERYPPDQTALPCSVAIRSWGGGAPVTLRISTVPQTRVKVGRNTALDTDLHGPSENHIVWYSVKYNY
jgi:hypothetical protein